MGDTFVGKLWYAHEDAHLVFRARPFADGSRDSVRKMKAVGVVVSENDGLLFHGPARAADLYVRKYREACRARKMPEGEGVYCLVFGPGPGSVRVLNRMLRENDFASYAATRWKRHGERSDRDANGKP